MREFNDYNDDYYNDSNNPEYQDVDFEEINANDAAYNYDEDEQVNSDAAALGFSNKKYISKRAFTIWLIIAMILTAVLTSLINGILIPKLNDAGFGNKSVTPTTYSIAKSSKSAISAEEIIAKNSPSVVEIRTESVARDGWLNNFVKQGAGSGVIINKNGYIVTNNHVIEGAEKITVTLKNGKAYNAKLIGRDPETDLAVVKISATGLKPAELGESSKLQMGQFVIAIGNPLGQLGGTATAGIVSSLNRRITIDGKELELLQTDASINPGNSGGGLFDNYGNLIGIVVAKSSGNNIEGIGFAIPIDKAKPIIDSMIKNGKLPPQPRVGIMISNVIDESMAREMNLPKPGVYVAKILTENAHQAGIQVGDRIVSLDGNKINDSQAFVKKINGYKVGQTIEIVVERDGKQIKLSVKLSDKNDIE